MKLVVVLKNTERAHLLLAVFNTALIFHFDMSELNADAKENTAREVKERKKERRKTERVRIDKMKLELSY